MVPETNGLTIIRIYKYKFYLNSMNKTKKKKTYKEEIPHCLL